MTAIGVLLIIVGLGLINTVGSPGGGRANTWDIIGVVSAITGAALLTVVVFTWLWRVAP